MNENFGNSGLSAPCFKEENAWIDKWITVFCLSKKLDTLREEIQPAVLDKCRFREQSFL